MKEKKHDHSDFEHGMVIGVRCAYEDILSCERL